MVKEQEKKGKNQTVNKKRGCLGITMWYKNQKYLYLPLHTDTDFAHMAMYGAKVTGCIGMQ